MVCLFLTEAPKNNLIMMTKFLMTKLFNFLFLLAVCLSFVKPNGVIWAQTPVPSDDAVNRIARQLYCPVCENVPLDECPTEACDQWRELIRQRLAEGWTDQEIKDYFVAQYGDHVLGDPPRRGLNWLLYLLPPVVIVVSLLLILTKLKPSKKQTQTTESDSDPFLEQVESDLEHWEQH